MNPNTRIYKFLRFSLLLLIGAVLISPAMAATYPYYYSPVFNESAGDLVHINQSWIINDNPGTPWMTWLFVGALGVALLLLSFILKPEQCSDIVSIMAWFPLITAATQGTATDYVTGFGVAGVETTVTGNSVVEWVLLENHSIYDHKMMSLMYLVFFVISILNTYRIWLNNRRLKETINGETL